MFVLISCCWDLFKLIIPLINAELYFPFKLQFISFLIILDPEDNIKFSTKLFDICRPNDINLNLAVSNTNGVIDFYYQKKL